jgi:hypothetical protein
MGRMFGIILMLCALYVGLTLYTEGTENAFHGLFSPLESQNTAESPMATGLTGLAQQGDAPTQTRRQPIYKAIGERVEQDLEYGARRRGYED